MTLCVEDAVLLMLDGCKVMRHNNVDFYSEKTPPYLTIEDGYVLTHSFDKNISYGNRSIFDFVEQYNTKYIAFNSFLEYIE